MDSLKRVILGGFLIISSVELYADVSSKLNITEEDGVPSTYPYKLKVTNGSLTDNGDGTTSLSTGGGGAATLPLPPGDTNYIQNTSTLQSGAVFNVSSGTIVDALTGALATFQTTYKSTSAFQVNGVDGNSIFRVDNTVLVSTDTIWNVTASTATTWAFGVATNTVTGPWDIHVSSAGLVSLLGTDAPANSQALCLLGGSLGHCTSVVGIGGGCTCVSP